MKEELRKRLEGFEGKSGEPKRAIKVPRVLESWRKKRSWG